MTLRYVCILLFFSIFYFNLFIKKKIQNENIVSSWKHHLLNSVYLHNTSIIQHKVKRDAVNACFQPIGFRPLAQITMSLCLNSNNSPYKWKCNLKYINICLMCVGVFISTETVKTKNNNNHNCENNCKRVVIKINDVNLLTIF